MTATKSRQQRAEDFVRLWQESLDVAAVAKALRLAPATVQAMASRFRRAGVPLKRMPAGRRPLPALDVAKLVELAEIVGTER